MNNGIENPFLDPPSPLDCGSTLSERLEQEDGNADDYPLSRESSDDAKKLEGERIPETSHLPGQKLPDEKRKVTKDVQEEPGMSRQPWEATTQAIPAEMQLRFLRSFATGLPAGDKVRQHLNAFIEQLETGETLVNDLRLQQNGKAPSLVLEALAATSEQQNHKLVQCAYETLRGLLTIDSTKLLHLCLGGKLSSKMNSCDSPGTNGSFRDGDPESPASAYQIEKDLLEHLNNPKELWNRYKTLLLYCELQDRQHNNDLRDLNEVISTLGGEHQSLTKHVPSCTELRQNLGERLLGLIQEYKSLSNEPASLRNALRESDRRKGLGRLMYAARTKLTAPKEVVAHRDMCAKIDADINELLY